VIQPVTKMPRRSESGGQAASRTRVPVDTSQIARLRVHGPFLATVARDLGVSAGKVHQAAQPQAATRCVLCLIHKSPTITQLGIDIDGRLVV
jgi:hypothetical protein